MTVAGVKGQVKILAESLKPDNDKVFQTDVECQGYVDTVINVSFIEELSSGGPPLGQERPEALCRPPYQEFSVEVVAENWSCAFFMLVNRFFQGCRTFQDRFKRSDIASLLQMSSFNVLKKEFWPDDTNIPIEFFSLGNLMTPYKFLNHFKLCEGTVELEALNQCERTPDNTDGILADFEHDQNKLKVKFGYITPSPTARGSFLAYSIRILTVEFVVEGYRSAGVYVNVPYNSVRRIIVDWDHINETEIHGAKLYLHLNFPVEIKQSKKKDNKFQKPPERYLTWDQQNAPPDAISDCPVLMLCFKAIPTAILYNVLSRMRSRCNLILEFCSVTIENSLPYLPAPMVDDNLKKFIEKVGNYGLAYLIEALSSRGSIVNDHFLTSEHRRNVFISKIMTHFKKDANGTLETLERLLNTLDEHLEIRDLFGVYAKIHQKVTDESQNLKEEMETQKSKGFQRVRKVVITPTRKLLVVPELLMGNRFLRTHDESGEHTLRVQFRDDDSQQLRANKCGEVLIERTVGEALRNGIIVAGRLYKYMGSSNSQMRDNGCYFFNAEASSDIHETIRKQFGKFDTNNIPKLMSRFGQCFTQARRSGVALERNMYNRIPDIIGGDDLKGEPYTYSDGVGNVSAWYAKNLAADFNIDEGCVPSVFQVIVLSYF
ncbi:hypothetical protein L596_027681 [Steinernema carpocapsae]|uniref:RNA-dependent RNA polymerase n=1 Tax=Steinernema carpocapsae TaxID=34508 RepID=A0A4U5LW99_STECR|nr:hypothetical protein L596_027681 [Steinernema carpocapsae]